jgi:predicted nucleic acid-binding protein
LILLDTNVVSELMKSLPDQRVEGWYLAHADDTGLTAVALGELAYGIARLPEGARRGDLAARLVEWRVRYADRTYPFSASAALRYGELMAQRERDGRPMSLPDGQIAAIAIDLGAQVATRNIRDFEGCGVKLIDPWQ